MELKAYAAPIAFFAILTIFMGVLWYLNLKEEEAKKKAWTFQDRRIVTHRPQTKTPLEKLSPVTIRYQLYDLLKHYGEPMNLGELAIGLGWEDTMEDRHIISMNISGSIHRKQSIFVRVRRGVYGLHEWNT